MRHANASELLGPQRYLADTQAGRNHIKRMPTGSSFGRGSRLTGSPASRGKPGNLWFSLHSFRSFPVRAEFPHKPGNPGIGRRLPSRRPHKAADAHVQRPWQPPTSSLESDVPTRIAVRTDTLRIMKVPRWIRRAAVYALQFNLLFAALYLIATAFGEVDIRFTHWMALCEVVFLVVILPYLMYMDSRRSTS